MLTLLTADTEAIGRFNSDAMTDQMRMEVFVSGVKNVSNLQDADGAFLPICEWPGITFDAEDRVTKVNFDMRPGENFSDSDGELDDVYVFFIGPGGRFDFQWLPKSLKELSVAALDVKGTVDTKCLPELLSTLDASYNLLSGPFCLKGLPQSIEHVMIEVNAFSGSLHIAEMPRSMLRFNGGRNEFFGTVCLQDLPPKMSYFDVQRNQLTGSISMRDLPPPLLFFSVERNSFSQDKLVVGYNHVDRLSCFLDKEVFGRIEDEDGNDISSKFQR